VPTASGHVLDVHAEVARRRNREEATAFAAVAAQSAREVDGPRAEHDGGVRQRRVPAARGGASQARDEAADNAVARPSNGDELRTDADRLGRRNQHAGGVRSRREHDRQRGEAADVEVDVDSAVVVQQEVAGDVGALDRVRVGEIGGKQPRIAVGHEVFQFGVRPQAVDEFVVQTKPRLGGGFPPGRNLRCGPHCVYDACVRLGGVRGNVVAIDTNK